jgi:hypothetical protein
VGMHHTARVQGVYYSWQAILRRLGRKGKQGEQGGEQGEEQGGRDQAEQGGEFEPGWRVVGGLYLSISWIRYQTMCNKLN